MKKCIAITTLPGNFNYGNRLQAYALKRVIEKGTPYEVDHIIPLVEKHVVLRWSKILFVSVLSGHPTSFFMKIKKERAISPFSRTYLRETTFGRADRYVRGIVGSDQVWHPDGIKPKNLDRYFMAFLPPSARVAYAPSFGVSVVPDEKKAVYKTYLSEFAYISVREQSGAAIIKDITGRTAPVVLDPTLLLSREEWGEFTANLDVALQEEKYIFRYTLGALSEEDEEQLADYAKKHDLTIYRVMGDSMESGGVGEIPTVPEFLARIKNAQAVFTDSFHACVFATIFHVPFVALKRPGIDMSSRIETLLENTGMENNFNNDNRPFEMIIAASDFSEIDERISMRRSESLKYLVNALKGMPDVQAGEAGA